MDVKREEDGVLLEEFVQALASPNKVDKVCERLDDLNAKYYMESCRRSGSDNGLFMRTASSRGVIDAKRVAAHLGVLYLARVVLSIHRLMRRLTRSLSEKGLGLLMEQAVTKIVKDLEIPKQHEHILYLVHSRMRRFGRM